MASARNKPPNTANDQSFVPRIIDIRGLFPGDQYDIQYNAGLQPQYIVVRQIDLAPPGSPYPFLFKSPDRRYAFATHTLQEIVGKLIDGTYKPNGAVNHYYRPLDVKLPAPTCFVFNLSSDWPWRFSTKQDGATLGEPDAAVQQRYANLLHFKDTNGSAGHHGHDDFCRTICFTAVPELDNQVPPKVKPFNHRFNLVVEFVYPDGDEPYKENLIPVIIDPDVRYPGGSG